MGGADRANGDQLASVAPAADECQAQSLAVFWQAAARLEQSPEDASAAEDAGTMVCDLAMSNASTLLEAVLRVDLRCETRGWSVACYEIGDGTPSAFHEYDGPVAAVDALIGCGTLTHVASELICTGDDALQWVAMSRARNRVRFHLPTEQNTSAATSDRLQEALDTWRQVLLMARVPDRVVRKTSARIRAPRALDLISDPDSDRPASSDDVWPDDPEDESGFSHAALVALGLVKDEDASLSGAGASAGPSSPDSAAITGRTLNSAVRTALAGAVPYLETQLGQSLTHKIEELPDAIPTGMTQRLDRLDERVETLIGETRALDLVYFDRRITQLLDQHEQLIGQMHTLQRRHLATQFDLRQRICELEAKVSGSPDDMGDDE